jgi:hypothetical protein
MPIFRAYCLDANGRINYGEDVDAPDLERVIDVARALGARQPPPGSHGIEIWQDKTCLYTSDELRRQT